jgi:hypothetical protein
MFRRRAGMVGWVAVYGAVGYMVVIAALGIFVR